MAVGRAYKREKLEESWDTIVIGSGMGGLATAALLAKHAGQRVLVLERHYEAGGFTHVFRRPEYEWDVGVHYVGGVRSARSQIRRIFDHLTDHQLDWSPMPAVYDRILIGERSYDFPSGVERFRQQMQHYFPGESLAIDRYLAAVFSVTRWMGLYMAEKAIPAPLARWLGGLMRWPFLRWSNQTTGDVIRQFTSNPELAAVLTGQWGDYGLPPGKSSFAMHAAVVGHYLGGAGYPVGGSSRIAAGIAPVIEAAGGRILINAEVTSILLEGDRAVGVRMADGRELRAAAVVSDAGAINTFAKMLPVHHPAVQPMLQTLSRIPPSESHICLYLGYKQAEEFAATNLWIYGGPDHDARVARFLQDPSSELPLVFISFPSAKDPTFATRYPGRSTVEVVALAPYGSFSQWSETRWKKRGADYDAYKCALQTRLLEVLDRHLPGARAALDYQELSTPLSTRHFANHPSGEIYGLAHTPARFGTRQLQPRTAIRGLYLSGSDACICGVAGSLMGGILAASAMLGRNMFSVASKR